MQKGTRDIESAPATSRPPSGLWRGWYARSGVINTTELLFYFQADGHVDGQGTDILGGFEVHGVVSQDVRRVAFQKRYIAGSPAASGRPNERLDARKVTEFRGAFEGTFGDGSGPAQAAPTGTGDGIVLRGEWYLTNCKRPETGLFMLAPVTHVDRVE